MACSLVHDVDALLRVFPYAIISKDSRFIEFLILGGVLCGSARFLHAFRLPFCTGTSSCGLFCMHFFAPPAPFAYFLRVFAAVTSIRTLLRSFCSAGTFCMFSNRCCSWDKFLCAFCMQLHGVHAFRMVLYVFAGGASISKLLPHFCTPGMFPCFPHAFLCSGDKLVLAFCTLSAEPACFLHAFSSDFAAEASL